MDVEEQLRIINLNSELEASMQRSQEREAHRIIELDDQQCLTEETLKEDTEGREEKMRVDKLKSIKTKLVMMKIEKSQAE